ncbi:MAG TPA: UPF0149 family protein [Nevskiaceae bacterium]|nr:UPF0149 family protein [Nevskiaceae bacterium]
MDAPSHSALTELLRALGLDESASEYHGALCGALCRQAAEDLSLHDLLDGEAAPPGPAQAGALQRLSLATQAALQDADLVFTPLLPEDDRELGLRVQALADWCQGFLYGLASQRQLELSSLSEEAREILRDLTQFTQAGWAAEDDQEIEESAYAELVEYLRVGVQLLYLELHPPAADGGEAHPGNSTLH